MEMFGRYRFQNLLGSMAMQQEPIDWWYRSIYWWPMFEAEISGNTPTKYGQKYGTNVPPFYDPEIPIDILNRQI